VLTLVTHHTASDEWSVQVIVRDLAACYRARVAGTVANLPQPVQYSDFSEYQTSCATGPTADDARAYWQKTLQGARIFALPTDRLVPEVHTTACSAHYFTVDADVLVAAGGATRAVLIAAFNVLIHHIAGSADQSVDTLTTGRSQGRFADSVGPLMNFLVYRTDIAACVTFADVVARTARTCAGADAHEIPIQHIEQAVPELMAPNDDAWSTNCILGVFDSPFTSAELRIADSSRQIHRRTQPAAVGPWIPHGVAWALHLLPTGGMAGLVQFNTEELDADTVAGWVSRFTRILTNAADAGRHWRTL
jgi:hypothetical protein